MTASTAHPRLLILGLLLISFSLASFSLAVRPVARDLASAAPALQDPIPAGHIVVRGRIDYIDRESDRSHAAAGVRVDIWDLDEGFPAPGEVLDSTRTDANGFFESKAILNQDRDGPGGEPGITGQDIYLKLYSDNGDVRLLKEGTELNYVWQSYEINERTGINRNVSDGLVNMERLVVMEDTPNVAALWTFVNMSEAWLFMQAASGRDPGQVVGYWSPESSDGPRYDASEKRLYFRSDTAGYSDVVVQHTAYALLDNLLGGLPEAWDGCTAGPDTTIKTAVEEACAFVQGFGTYLPLAVYRSPLFESQSARTVDMDAPKPVSPGWENGDLVPGRIAGAFWDLDEHDETVEDHDAFNASFADIWEVIDTRRPETMPEWWAGWKALGKDSCGASGSLFQNSIDYNAAPVVARIPDVIIDEDETFFINLHDYITDDECDADALEIEITDFGTPEAGVTLNDTGVISITPAANWFGETLVRLSVSDGSLTTNFTIRIVVNSVNDCPEILPRVPDPDPALHGDEIRLDLLSHGRDVEDRAGDLTWDVRLVPPFSSDISVTGRGTFTLVFSLDPRIVEDYNARIPVVVRDRDGCETAQDVVLTWTAKPNNPPFIWRDRLNSDYEAPINTGIKVDLTGVADDVEDPADELEWFVTNPGDLDCEVERETHQIFNFGPDLDFVGSNVVQLEVRDSVGARATGTITLTWVDPSTLNVPPTILRAKLRGKTVGSHPTTSPLACYDLHDKAIDPDDPIASLRWFVDNYDTSNLRVTGMGTRRICMQPRAGFIGCEPARFVVRDPKGGEDTHEITTCWREIKEFMPYVSSNKPRR